MGPGKTGLAGSLHKPLRVPGARGKKNGSWLLLTCVSRKGEEIGRGLRLDLLHSREMDHTCLRGSRAARASVGTAGRCRPQVYHRVAQTSSLLPLARDAEPRGGCSSQTTQPSEICSFQLPPETGKLLTARGRLPACLRGDSFAKSNGGFQRVRLFWEPSCYPNPIKNHLGASELPQASPKVS